MSLPAFWAALALCGWASGSAPTGAPPDNGDVVALASPSTATLLGELVVVQATARLAAAESLALDLQRSTTDNMAITSIRELAPTAAVRRFELSIVPLDLGSRVFPIYWTLTSAGSTRTLSTNLHLDVREPPGAAQAQDIKDIKPPRNAWPRLWPWLLLAAAALGAWGWARWGSRRDRSSVAATDGGVDIRPPEVIAEEELARLHSAGLWEAGRHKEFYGGMTDILRRYLERRRDFPATRATTAELYRRLRLLEFDPKLLAVLKELFDRADLVKFSKIPAREAWGGTDLATARRLVRETTPAASAAPAADMVRP